MKRVQRVLAFLLVFCVLLSAFPVTTMAANSRMGMQVPKKNIPVSTVVERLRPLLKLQKIDIAHDQTEPLQIRLGEEKDIEITSSYAKPLEWTVFTTRGSASISPKRTVASGGYHTTTLSVKSSSSGSGIVFIYATDSTNRWVTSFRPLNLEFVETEDQPPANQAPVFEGTYTITTVKNVPASTEVVARDPDGDALTYSFTQPSHGLVSQTGTTYEYRPEEDYVGADSFTVTASDGVDSTSVTVNVTVKPLEEPPAPVFSVKVNYGVASPENPQVGDPVTITANPPADGEAFKNWTVNSGNVNLEDPSASTTSFIMPQGNVEVTANYEVVPDQEKIYVALGDSIPCGKYYTLSNPDGIQANSYVDQLSQEMGIDETNSHNMSVSGDNAFELLDKLRDDGSQLQDLVSKADVITLCVGANDIMDAVERVNTGLDKYSVDWDIADRGRDSFEESWYQIIDRIEDLNPDVTLIVMTIYNPYRSTDQPIYDQINPYFEETTPGNYGLNYIIRNTKTLYNDCIGNAFDYRVADVYQAFNSHSNKDSLTGFYGPIICDPHPNQEGHNVIFAVHKDVL